MGLFRFAGLVPAYALFVFATSPLVHAASVPAIPPIDTSVVLPQAIAGEIVKTLGILTDHRPYSGAAPLLGFDLGIEASLVHLPSGFGSRLSAQGLLSDTSKFDNGALPMPKVHLRKGLGQAMDIGFSGILYSGIKIWGVDAKIPLFQPEEGLTWAFRISYSDTSIDLSKFGFKGLPIKVDGVDLGTMSLKLATRTITPAVLSSVRMDFAEPYFGVAAQFTTGQIQEIVNLSVQDYTQTMTTPAASYTQGYFFTGVSFRVPSVGLHLTMEGGYGTLGMSSLGTEVGFSF